MNPEHHPDPEELIGYASGASPEWASLVVACHLTYCEACRGEVALLDDLGGALLDTLPVDARAPVGSAGKVPERRDAGPERQPKAEIPPLATEAKLPRPLHGYFEEQVPRWRFLAPGVQQIPLSFSVGGIRAKVVKFKSGFTVPEHAHTGLELVLVLDGELADSVTQEVFRAGDLSRRDVDATHRQFVTSEVPCVCLVVSTAPIVPTSAWGRLLKALTGV